MTHVKDLYRYGTTESRGIILENSDVVPGDLVKVYCGYQFNWRTRELISTTKSYEVIGVIVDRASFTVPDSMVSIEVLSEHRLSKVSSSSISISQTRVNKIGSLEIAELLTHPVLNLRKLGKCLNEKKSYFDYSSRPSRLSIW